MTELADTPARTDVIGASRLPARLADGTGFERNCSVGRTVALIGDGWSFMILRECYFGVRRFQTFQTMLGLPKGTLAARLAMLTRQALLQRIQYSEKPPRFEYKLTERGFDLYKVMLSLLRFGDKWLAGDADRPLKLIHRTCGHESHPFVACPHCHKEVNAREVQYRDGPGAGWTPIAQEKKSRRSADPTALERRRPSSVARALNVIGDRWSFMVAREAFFGIRRFDGLQDRLGIAPSVLADRLTRLADLGVFNRVLYQSNPDRYEYRLTDMGRDLFGPFLAMLAWGDRWLSEGKPPLILTHLACGHDFVPEVLCDHCQEPVKASDMRYKMAYPNPIDEAH
ncbi:MAG: winged helix-turn-helix transcriptional regulator [Burkholderiales bacterium]